MGQSSHRINRVRKGGPERGDESGGDVLNESDGVHEEDREAAGESPLVASGVQGGEQAVLPLGPFVSRQRSDQRRLA